VIVLTAGLCGRHEGSWLNVVPNAILLVLQRKTGRLSTGNAILPALPGVNEAVRAYSRNSIHAVGARTPVK
jgi:hypothetical protein